MAKEPGKENCKALSEFNKDDYPFTVALLNIYDNATDWQKECGGEYTHRELFRFACQCKELNVQVKVAECELAKIKKETEELRQNRVILEAIKRQGFLKG